MGIQANGRRVYGFHTENRQPQKGVPCFYQAKWILLSDGEARGRFVCLIFCWGPLTGTGAGWEADKSA